PRGDQPGLFRPLDLPVDGGVRCASLFRDLGQAELKVRVSEQEREDLSLLPGTQDGEQRRTWLSIHNLNNTLHFVDSRLGPAASGDGLTTYPRSEERLFVFWVVNLVPARCRPLLPGGPAAGPRHAVPAGLHSARR